MKFLCDNCKAKYQIADEKVAGKTVRMKCRKCGHQIEVRAEVTEQSVSMAMPKPPSNHPQEPARGPLATSLSTTKPRAPAAHPASAGALAGAFQRTVQDAPIAPTSTMTVSSSSIELSVTDEWYVAINGVDRSSTIRSVAAHVEAAELNTTDMASSGWMKVIAGLKSGNVQLGFVQDMAASAIDSVMWPLFATVVTFEDLAASDTGDILSFKEIAEKIPGAKLDPVVGRASVSPEGSTNGFGTHICDVEVDPETGKVTILRYTAIQDAGKAVHPSYVEGQMQGGSVQGIGWALNEEYFYDKDGHLLNSSLLDYRMPTTLDVPMIETVMVEVANPGHPYGVRGVGEVPIVPPAAAIANAIYHATGKRLYHLPLNPARVVNALQGK